MRLMIVLLFTITLFAAAVNADPGADAKMLKDEAMVTLRASANGKSTPDEYAECIVKLEKAQAILEGSKDNDSVLAQEVNSALFWARRFSNLEISKAVEKLHGGASAHKPSPKPAEPAQKPAESIPEAKQLAEAKAAFDAAEKFAKTRAGDDYAVALRWFEMANTHSGTEYALKALELGREAQGRVNKGTQQSVDAAKPADPRQENTPEMELVRKADGLASAGQLDQAIASYKASIKLKDTAIAEGSLAHVYFRRAEQMSDELGPQFKKLEPAYQQAYKNAWQRRTVGGTSMTVFNENDPGWVDAQRRYRDLQQKLDEATRAYVNAGSCFEAVLKLSPDKRDFDAAGYCGICLARRADSRFRASDTLRKFLKEYPPADDDQRFLYEFCKSELERLAKR
jgi:hypothetical protein